MGADEGTSNGDAMECHEDVQCFRSEAVNNGFKVDFVHDSGDGSSGASDSFRTYKRRRHTRSSSESKIQEEGRASVEGACQSADKVHLPGLQCCASFNYSDDRIRWRKFLLEQMYQSITDDEGGIHHCIQDALLFHPEISHAWMAKEFDACCENGSKHSPRTGPLPNGRNHRAEQEGVMTNGPEKDNHQTVTEMCQRIFFNSLMSDKFTSLCKLLFENFQGIKADSILPLNIINSRMKKGEYEQSPMLFLADLQQVWRKLEEIGTEVVSLAKSLSDMSTAFYSEQFHTQDARSHAKQEQTEACGNYKVYTCRRCREKADGRECLVCDSCEEIYHVGCIEPAVKKIPPKSWYCGNCTANGMGSPHENCVVCEKLNAPRTLGNHVDDEFCPSNGETFDAFEDDSYCSMDNGRKQSTGSKSLCVCKICKGELDNGEKFRECEHCLNKFHVRCLTTMQLKNFGPRWYCPSCLCRVCLIDKDDDKIVLCDGCDHAYHIYCMKPPRNSIPRGKWFCGKCDDGIQRIHRAKRVYQNLEVKLVEKMKEDSHKNRGGMDMLLNAAKTLSFEELATCQES